MRRASGPPRAARGFTLIEILIVVTVIGILMGIALPGLLTALDKSKQVSTLTLIRAFGEALEVYQSDNHFYPNATTIQALTPLLRPYSDTLRPMDQWKHDLSYVTDTTHYTVESFGKDGIDGAEVTPQTRYTFELDILLSDGTWMSSVE